MESERRLPGAAQYPRPEGISGKCYSPRNLQCVKRWRTPSPRNSATGTGWRVTSAALARAFE
jgi:hypothetical protein